MKLSSYSILLTALFMQASFATETGHNNSTEKTMDKMPMDKMAMGNMSMGKMRMGKMRMKKMNMNAPMHIHNTHSAGQWMFEYKFMPMSMDSLLQSKQQISPLAVTGTMKKNGPYMMSPTKMTTNMHMLMAMYGANNRFSIMGMVRHLTINMDMSNRMGVKNSMQTSGVSDSLLGLSFKPLKSLSATMGLSLPTGSIEQHVTMMDTSGPAPYAMQLGSGTFDLLPSIAYRGSSRNWGWGAQTNYVARLSNNSHHYTLGNRLDVSTWGKYVFTPGFLVSGSLAYTNRQRIDGQDTEINPRLSPTADPTAQGGDQGKFYLGASGFFKRGHMIGIEVGYPFYQDLNGTQLKPNTTISFNYQYMIM